LVVETRASEAAGGAALLGRTPSRSFTAVHRHAGSVREAIVRRLAQEKGNTASNRRFSAEPKCDSGARNQDLSQSAARPDREDHHDYQLTLQTSRKFRQLEALAPWLRPDEV
jgi:hypothetical protein